MKKIVYFISLLFLPFVLNAQIRNYVGIVRGQYQPEIVNFLEDFKTSLDDNGYSSFSRYIDSFIDGTFGSGFVYVDNDGTNYIITNRHVINLAKTASIEFEDINSDSTKKYEDLSIVILDEDIDLAILKFKNNSKPFNRGIPISSAKLSDGQDVWSAGFPGLAGDPVWQLGKGTVTNSRAKIKDLLDPSISTIIQHSAEVDGGNSGGPLLISAKNSVGYEVVGINTWKAVSRQNTNFAIPASLITRLINNSKTQSENDNLKAAQERSATLLEKLNNEDEDFKSIAKYISDELTIKQGKEAFIKALQYADSQERNFIAATFSQSPFEGIRYSVAYQIWKDYSVANSNEPVTLISDQMEGSTYNAIFKNNDSNKNISLEWYIEGGMWKVKSVKQEENKKASKKTSTASTKTSAENKTEKANSGFKINPSTKANVSIGVGFTPEFAFNSFSLSAEYWAFYYVGFNLRYNDLFPGTKNALHTYNVGLAARLPLELNDCFLFEVVGKTDFVVALDSNSTRGFYKGFSCEFGLNFIYTDFNKFKPGIGGSYSYLILGEQNNSSKTEDYHQINLYLIFAF